MQDLVLEAYHGKVLPSAVMARIVFFVVLLQGQTGALNVQVQGCFSSKREADAWVEERWFWLESLGFGDYVVERTVAFR